MYLRFCMNKSAIGDCSAESVEFTVQCTKYSSTKRIASANKDGVTDEVYDMEFGNESITLCCDGYDTCYVMNDSGDTMTVIRARRWHSKESLLDMLDCAMKDTKDKPNEVFMTDPKLPEDPVEPQGGYEKPPKQNDES